MACEVLTFTEYRRIKYEQTIGDIKKAVEEKLKIPVEKQQLFWLNKELTTARDGTTLLELGLHTGAALKGYDLVRKSTKTLLAVQEWLLRDTSVLHHTRLAQSCTG